MTNIIIDTNIWHYAYVEPKEEGYLKIHEQARKFLKDTLLNPEITVAITTHQISEILDLLRKGGVSRLVMLELFEAIKSKKFIIKELTAADIESSFKKSLDSGIHIYDYLVTLPLKGLVEKIYSADAHLQHKDFKDIAKVENPVFPWILKEGKKPVQQLQR